MQSLDGFTNVLTGEPIDAAALTKMLFRQAGTTLHTARFRVCDMARNPLDVMPATALAGWRSDILPWDTSDISPLINLSSAAGSGPASLSHDVTRPVHRQLQCAMLDPTSDPSLGMDSFPYNPLQHCLHVSHVYVVPLLGITFEVPLGYFVSYLGQVTIYPKRRYYTWTALDLTGLISDADFLSDYAVWAGLDGAHTSGYLGCFQDMMMVDGLPITQPGGKGVTPTGNDDAGPAFPLANIPIGTALFPNNGNAAVDRDYLFQAGSNRLDAGNQLLSALNFYPCWVDGGGFLRSRQQYDFGTADSPNIPPIDIDLSPMPETSLMESPIGRDFQSLASASMRNIAKVESTPTVAGNTSGALNFSSLQVNTGLNDQGDVISLIGTSQLKALGGGPRALPYYERNDKLASQAVTDRYANALLQEGASAPDTLTLSMLPFSLFEDHDIVVCNIQDAYGTTVVASDASSPFQVQSWTLPLGGANARMSLSLSRVVPI